MKEQDMDALLSGQTKSGLGLDAEDAAFKNSLVTGDLGTSTEQWMNALSGADQDATGLDAGMFTSTPGIVGTSGGGSSADTGGGRGLGGIGAAAIRPDPTSAIRAPTVSKVPVSPTVARASSSLINHDSLNAYRRMRGLPPVAPPPRGIGGASMGAM